MIIAYSSNLCYAHDMAILDERRQEFVAKMIADLGKAIMTVAVASYFFERYPLIMRWLLPGFAIMMMVGSVVMHPPQPKESPWKRS